MKVTDALPNLFRRPFPVVRAGTPLIVASTVLDVLHYDMQLVVTRDWAEALLSGERGAFFAVGGLTLLKRVLEAGPEGRYKVLYEPAERGADLLVPLRADAEVSDVFEAFSRSRFGYALVESEGKYGIVRLSDLVSLCRRRVIDIEITAGEVASRVVYAMRGDATLKLAMEEMIRRRIRRVFIEGEDAFVSDRSIMSLIFSAEGLARLRESPASAFDLPISEVAATEAERVKGDQSVRDVAATYRPSSGAWCLLCEEGLLTPWDLVMKPWAMGRVRI